MRPRKWDLLTGRGFRAGSSRETAAQDHRIHAPRPPPHRVSRGNVAGPHGLKFLLVCRDCMVADAVRANWSPRPEIPWYQAKYQGIRRISAVGRIMRSCNQRNCRRNLHRRHKIPYVAEQGKTANSREFLLSATVQQAGTVKIGLSNADPPPTSRNQDRSGPSGRGAGLASLDCNHGGFFRFALKSCGLDCSEMGRGAILFRRNDRTLAGTASASRTELTVTWRLFHG